MTITGYSDRINHALAFAAKHHDQLVRQGVRAPYGTQAANVAVILTRYGADEETVVAGILYGVIEDCIRESGHGDQLLERVSDKFGSGVVELALSVAERRHDQHGVEMNAEERRRDLLKRLDRTNDRARWVFAADEVHQAGTMLADLARTDYPEIVWGRTAAGREGTIAWFRAVHDRLVEVGFREPIVEELSYLAERLANDAVELKTDD